MNHPYRGSAEAGLDLPTRVSSAEFAPALAIYLSVVLALGAVALVNHAERSPARSWEQRVADEQASADRQRMLEAHRAERRARDALQRVWRSSCSAEAPCIEGIYFTRL